MDDGVRIDASLLLPDGPAPTGGWPAVMLFHGLGGNHKDLVAGLATPYLARATPSSPPTRAGTAPRAASSRSTGRAKSQTSAPSSSGSPRGPR